METGRLSEAGLAALLAEVLGDEAFWSEVAVVSPGLGRSPRLGRRAVELYVASGAFLAERGLGGDQGEPVWRGVGALREIADAAALRSTAWASDRDGIVWVASRPLVEWLIRTDGVDSWAAGLGFPLPLSESGVFPYEEWPAEPPAAAELTAAEFVTVWTTVSDTYEGVQHRRGSDSPSEWLQVLVNAEQGWLETAREGAGALIYETRNWLRWARGHLPAAAEPLAVAALFMAQSAFVALHERVGEDPEFPTREYLGGLLRGSDALDWLAANGGQIPAWLP